MAVLAKELEREYADKPDLSGNLILIRQQIDRCKSILARMAIDAGQLQAESGYSTTLDDYLSGLVKDWQATRVDVEVHINMKTGQPGPLIIMKTGQPGPLIIADHTLNHALVNVLNNAADAAANRAEIETEWNNENLTIKIHDDGHGIGREILNHLGKTIITSKTQNNGMGLGLFLAQTTFNRYGGGMQLNNHGDGGVTATISLPPSSIIAD